MKNLSKSRTIKAPKGSDQMPSKGPGIAAGRKNGMHPSMAAENKMRGKSRTRP